jgi:3-phenylpropionate/trans-cinnamate dioxygenase ferredoxin reductase subunit
LKRGNRTRLIAGRVPPNGTDRQVALDSIVAGKSTHETISLPITIQHWASHMKTVVIVGAGHAGFQSAASLRQEGYDGNIVLIGDEPGLPYQRPPLSKAYLLGKAAASDLIFRSAHFYSEHRLKLLPGRAIAIDRAARAVDLDSGERITYDHLVLATGSQPRRLTIPGSNLDGVLTLQTLADADALRPRLHPGRRVVVIGAGFIGLEFAAVARSLGLAVNVVDVADRALARGASAESANVLVDALSQRGVQLHFRCGIVAIHGSQGRVGAVQASDGTTLPADLVLIGIGAEPRAELAQHAGLEVENGVCVDDQLATSDPAISAIGDVAAVRANGSAARIRLESVQNATDHARRLAVRLTTKPLSPPPVPWFWSDQGELKLQIAGLREHDDEHVVLAGPQSASHSVLCIRDGDHLAAVETINRPADHMLARRLLAKGVRVTASQARTPGFQLKSLG